MKFMYILATILLVSNFNLISTQCPRVCTRQYQPVCGESRWRLICTFGNPCMLRVAQCTHPDDGWRPLHSGECRKPQHPECRRVHLG